MPGQQIFEELNAEKLDDPIEYQHSFGRDRAEPETGTLIPAFCGVRKETWLK